MVDSTEFISRLTSIFRQELDNDRLTIDMDTTQSDISEWDSLAHVRIVMGVERAYNIQFEVEEIETIKTVRGFYDAVRRHSH